MNEDDYSDIKEIRIKSEKELNNEFETFNTLLIDTNGDWNKRVTAIKRLEGMILGGAFEIDNFPGLIAKLYPHISAQLNDLRSAVSKEACRLVCLAASVAEEKLDGLCDKLISRDGLLKLINNGNKLIAENGNECIMTLLQFVKCPKVIPRIIDELGSKNTAVRQKISVYLKMIMESYPENVLDKHLALIESAITSSIADASKEVRQTIRQTFMLYADRYPTRSPKLYSKFENSVQKALQEDSFNLQKIRPTSSKEIKEVPEKKRRDVSANREVIKETKEVKESKEAPKENKFSAKPITPPPKKGNGKPLTESQEIKKDFNTLDNRTTRASEASITSDKNSLQHPSQKRSSSIYKPQGGRVSSPPKKREESASRILSTSMHIQGNSSSEKKNSKPSSGVMKSQVLNHSHLLEEKESSRPSTSTSASSKQFPSHRASLKELGKKGQEEQVSNNKGSKVDHQALLANFYQSVKEEDLKFLLEKIRDDNWAVRANSFDKINEFITEMKPNEHISNTLLENLIETHVAHLNDPHYKVIICCEESFSKIITIYRQKILLAMERIIPPLFINLTESKDKVYQSTNFLINLINKIYTGDELFPHFLKSLDYNHKAKYKASLLEFMNILMRNCKVYFNGQLTVRSCISKLAIIMHDFANNKNIMLPCLGMILYLRDLNFDVAMSAVTTLNHTYLQTLRSVAAHHATDLDENIKLFNLQQRMALKQELPPSGLNANKMEKLRLGPQNLSMDHTKLVGKSVNDPSPISITEVDGESRGSTGKFADQRKRGPELIASFKEAHEHMLKPKKQEDDMPEEEDEEDYNGQEDNQEEHYENGDQELENEDEQNGEENEQEQEEEDQEGEENEAENEEEEEGQDQDEEQEVEGEEEEGEGEGEEDAEAEAEAEGEEQEEEGEYENEDENEEEQENGEEGEEVEDEEQEQEEEKENYGQEEEENEEEQEEEEEAEEEEQEEVEDDPKPHNQYNYAKTTSREKVEEKVAVIKTREEPYEIVQKKPVVQVAKPVQKKPVVKERVDETAELSKIDELLNQSGKKMAYIEKNLDPLICQILEFFNSEEQRVVEYAIDVLRKILKLPLNFGMQIDQLLSCLIALYHTPYKIAPVVDDMVKLVLSLGYEDLSLHSMIENLDREDHPVLQILIKNITNLYLKSADPELTKFLPDLIAKYKSMINHPNPDVRKNVVFSIVDLHFVYKSEMQEYIQEFSPSHQKLIAIYIQKRTEKQKGK